MSINKPKLTREASDDFLNCVKPGKYLTWAVFVSTFGVAYLAQSAYMYNTKKFLKRNRAIRPLGIAGLTSYLFFMKVLVDCRREIVEFHPECFPSKNANSESTSSSGDEFDET